LVAGDLDGVDDFFAREGRETPPRQASLEEGDVEPEPAAGAIVGDEDVVGGKFLGRLLDDGGVIGAALLPVLVEFVTPQHDGFLLAGGVDDGHAEDAEVPVEAGRFKVKGGDGKHWLTTSGADLRPAGTALAGRRQR